jgi:hypothetical protein
MPPAFELHTNISALDKSLAAHRKSLAETLRDDLFRAEDLAVPSEAIFYPPDNAAVVLRAVSRNVTYDAVNTEVDHGQLFDLDHLEAMQNFDQKMKHVVEVVPGLQLIRLDFFFRRRLFELPGDGA